MVTGYEVSEDGTLTPVELSRESLDSTRVLCVVDDATKSIYLWKGSRANIRAKFVGARVATNLRTEYGFHFKVKPVEEGEEPPTFFSALDGVTTATPVMRPGQPSTARPQPQPASSTTPSEVTAKHETPTSTPPTPTPVTTPPTTAGTTAPATPPPPTRASEPATDTAKAQPTTTTTTPVRPPPVSTQPSTTTQTTGRTPAATPTPATTVAAQTGAGDIPPHIREMIEELETIDPPEGYERELLIVYNELFTIAERRFKVFGQERVERKFERVKEPPEGTFMAEGFIPRVIVKDGRVLGIELLRGTPDAILSPIKAEMRERLSDLITFFKSETAEETEEGQEAETKRVGRRRLVAK